MSVSILMNSPGKVLTSILFICSFSYLLFLALKNVKKYPSFSAFSGLLWLGFFGKTATLVTFGRGIKDPIGSFDGLGSQWDELFIVTSIGILALLMSFYFYTNFFSNNRIEKINLKNSRVDFNLNVNIKLFAFFSVMLISVALLNLKFGLILSGLASITHLPFKINAIVGWMLYLGFSMALSFMFLKSISIKRFLYICVGLLFLEGFCSSVSLISRGTFVFHVFPILVLITANRKFLNFSLKEVAAIFAVFSGVMILTVGGVTVTRNSLYDTYAFSESDFSNEITLKKYLNKIDNAFISNSVGVIGDLMINRWVGLEGAMAVVGYPDKSLSLMIDSLVRIPKVGVQDVYAKISGLVYDDNPRITFSFIPGPIAFLYYSGHFASVFIGLLLMGLFLLFADDLVWRLFKNPFLTVQISAYLAVNASQIGMSPFPLLKSLVLTSLGLILFKVFTNRTIVYNFIAQIFLKFWSFNRVKG